MPEPQRLTADTCRTKAEECGMLAKQAREQGHRIMLLHMAETWERLAEAYEAATKGRPSAMAMDGTSKEYRRKAHEVEDMARRYPNETDRRMLLDVAQQWRDLAELRDLYSL